MDASNEDQIVKIVDLNAPISKVWTALTDYKAFGAWFRVDLDQPFEPGKPSTGRMTYPGHEGVPWLAFVETMEPERLFSFRWHDEESSERQNGERPSLLVEFKLERVGDQTRLTIIESGFSQLPDARRIELMRGNTEGWNIQANNLTQYLTHSSGA